MESKMSELSNIVAELHQCGETLMKLSNSLREALTGETTQMTMEPVNEALAVPEEPVNKESSVAEAPHAAAEPAVTLEAVRAVLAEKSVNGHRAEVQQLIREFGAERLSAVDPANYAALKAKAEVL